MNKLIRTALLCISTASPAIQAQQMTQAAMPPGFGPNPQLPEPEHSLIPTINVAPSAPWQGDAGPAAAPGFTVRAYAAKLDHPRWLYVLPNGDVLVAEANSPPRQEDGIKGAVMKYQMKKAGALTSSANRITLLRDIDANGIAKTRTIFLQDLNSPFGMALVGPDLYIANADALLRFPYQAGQTSIAAAGIKVLDLPGGPINHHWTKNVVASPDGKYLYVSVGSNSNVGENGIAAETGRAAIWQFERASGKARVYASGLRNPVGMAWQPQSGALWTSVNERDALGNDLVPDYMTEVKDGGFYGWPYSYYGQHVDVRVKPQRPDLVARAIKPDYALGAHVAALGLTFSDGARLGPAYVHGAFVGEHGSWNREPPSGCKVVFVPFSGARPSGMPVDVLTGFLVNGKYYGRPVGVAIGADGSLLVADDVGNTVWRVSAA